LSSSDVKSQPDLFTPSLPDWRRYRKVSLGLAILATVLIVVGISVGILVYSPGVAGAAKAAFDLPLGDKNYYLLWAGVFVAAGAVLCIWAFRVFRQEVRDFQKQVAILEGKGKAALQTIEAMSPLVKR
jgi:hypothetical protein